MTAKLQHEPQFKNSARFACGNTVRTVSNSFADACLAQQEINLLGAGDVDSTE
jgi:hypothetical protein